MLERVGNWVFVKTELVYTLYMTSQQQVGTSLFFHCFRPYLHIFTEMLYNYLFQQETNEHAKRKKTFAFTKFTKLINQTYEE